MSLVFSKDLPQSSLTSQDDQSFLCIEKFENPPRTLYDEIGQQEQDFYYNKSMQEENEIDWKELVYKLQVENTSLINSLHEANHNLMQSRLEKEDLENFIQRQTETTDAIISKLQAQNQEKDNRILDLIFQKNYISLENQAFRQSHLLPTVQKKGLFKFRCCVYALIAVQRFRQLKE